MIRANNERKQIWIKKGVSVNFMRQAKEEGGKDRWICLSSTETESLTKAKHEEVIKTCGGTNETVNHLE